MALSEEIGKEAVRVRGNAPEARTASLLCEGGKVTCLLSGEIRGGWGGEEGSLEGKELGFSLVELGEEGEGRKTVSRGRSLGFSPGGIEEGWGGEEGCLEGKGLGFPSG